MVLLSKKQAICAFLSGDYANASVVVLLVGQRTEAMALLPA